MSSNIKSIINFYEDLESDQGRVIHISERFFDCEKIPKAVNLYNYLILEMNLCQVHF